MTGSLLTPAGMLFEDEVVLPGQLDGRGLGSMTPTQKLALAMLELAARDASTPPITAHGIAKRDDALRWVCRDDSDARLSFEACCDVLDISAPALRAGITALVESTRVIDFRSVRARIQSHANQMAMPKNHRRKRTRRVARLGGRA